MNKSLEKKLLKRIRSLIALFIFGLLISGITAFPIETELYILMRYTDPESVIGSWILLVYHAIMDVNLAYPFLAYGTDWLAFAHIVIALSFVGPLIDPIRNVWVIQFGIISCLMVFPLAFIAGSIRQIPFFWQLIDCSFGVIGLIPLVLSLRWTNKLMNLKGQRDMLWV